MPLTVSPLTPTAPLKEAKGAHPLASSFVQVLKEKLAQLNDLHLKADRLAQEYMAGKGVEIHQVVLALEEANLAFQLTLQVRNKLVEAYQELSRMQI